MQLLAGDSFGDLVTSATKQLVASLETSNFNQTLSEDPSDYQVHPLNIDNFETGEIIKLSTDVFKYCWNYSSKELNENQWRNFNLIGHEAWWKWKLHTFEEWTYQLHDDSLGSVSRISFIHSDYSNSTTTHEESMKNMEKANQERFKAEAVFGKSPKILGNISLFYDFRKDWFNWYDRW